MVRRKPLAAAARFNVVARSELVAAWQAAAERAGVSPSQWLRELVANAIGRPELAETRGRGKPLGEKSPAKK